MIQRPITYLPNTHGGTSYQSLHKNLYLGESPNSNNSIRQHDKGYRDESSDVQGRSYSGRTSTFHPSYPTSSMAASSRTVLGKEALKNKRDNQYKVRVGICFLNSIDAEAYAEKLIGTGHYQVVAIKQSHLSTADVVVILSDHCLPIPTSVPTLRIRRENCKPCSCCNTIESHVGWTELLQQIERSIDQTGVSLEQLEEPTPEQEVEIRTTHAARRGLPAELDDLTKRELDILQLVGKGMTVRDMAEYLQLAESTVGNHKYRLMKKLGAKTSLELLKIAMRCGLADLN